MVVGRFQVTMKTLHHINCHRLQLHHFPSYTFRKWLHIHLQKSHGSRIAYSMTPEALTLSVRFDKKKVLFHVHWLDTQFQKADKWVSMNVVQRGMENYKTC
ncbi:LOW QUALITY PROTEIN: DNA repair protein Rad4 containing protein [Phytophthora palmivora]|uniref:DNA repair protein Rad4 containing protein n=1 Tax=Phytophthora palmivora TaxID=4796 RepID=A0A2P4YCR7_9STRA|nr:LOW QUALITY PROTEIN: DNA repair protein Rad4 containing protein [Phytophthora palmivora]